MEVHAYYKSASTEGFFLNPHSVPELIVVAESFHLKPMFETLQGDTRYNLIEISAARVTLFRGSDQGLTRIKSFNLDNLKNPPQVEKRAIMKFFRDCDQMTRRFYTEDDTPTVVAGKRALIKLYVSANKFRTPFLKTIENDHDEWADVARYHRLATDALDTYNRRRALKGVFEFKFARKFGRAADSVTQVAMAAAKGEVKSLLIRGGVNLWGHIDRLTGNIKLKKPSLATVSDDILDDLGELVLKHGGEVHIMNPHEMPTQSPVAAVLSAASA